MKNSFKGILGVVAVAIVAGAAYFMLSASSADQTTDKFFTALAKEDFDAVYDMTVDKAVLEDGLEYDGEQSDLSTRAEFTSDMPDSMKMMTEFKNYKSFKVNDTKEEDGITTLTGTYTTTTGIEVEMNVELQKSGSTWYVGYFEPVNEDDYMKLIDQDAYQEMMNDYDMEDYDDYDDYDMEDYNMDETTLDNEAEVVEEN